MDQFIKYPHLERFGNPEVEGIEVGKCYIFPKIDGTNASVWFNGEIQAGSRGRHLSLTADNHGFLHSLLQNYDDGPFKPFFGWYGNRYRFYGEWLVPHTFKHYRDDAWRKFYIFDIYDHEDQKFLAFDKYYELIKSFDLEFIPPIFIVNNPTEGQLLKIIEGNSYLVKDGSGPGEGIVIKRYDYINQYGRTTWAKLVRNEFKEQNKLAFGITEAGEVFQVEVAMAQEAVTPELVAKERSKIENAILLEHDIPVAIPLLSSVEYDTLRKETEDRKKLCLYQNKGKLIPRLLETIYHSVCTEELYQLLKKHNFPIVDFKKLKKHVTAQTKLMAKDLF